MNLKLSNSLTAKWPKSLIVHEPNSAETSTAMSLSKCIYSLKTQSNPYHQTITLDTHLQCGAGAVKSVQLLLYEEQAAKLFSLESRLKSFWLLITAKRSGQKFLQVHFCILYNPKPKIGQQLTHRIHGWWPNKIYIRRVERQVGLHAYLIHSAILELKKGWTPSRNTRKHGLSIP